MLLAYTLWIILDLLLALDLANLSASTCYSALVEAIALYSQRYQG